MKKSELITRKEAAQILQASEKKIQRLTSQKHLTVTYQKRLQGGRSAFYQMDEILKVKSLLEAGRELPIIDVLTERATEDTPIDQMEPTAEEKPTSTISVISPVEAAAKLMLSLPEVTVLTHIPERILKVDLNKGRLRGLQIEKNWLVKRTDLDEYIRNIYVPKRG